MLPFATGIVLIAIRLRPSLLAQWSNLKLEFLSKILQGIFLAVIGLLIVLRLLLGATSNVATIISVSLWAHCLTGNGAVFLSILCGIALAIFCLLFLERFNR